VKTDDDLRSRSFVVVKQSRNESSSSGNPILYSNIVPSNYDAALPFSLHPSKPSHHHLPSSRHSIQGFRPINRGVIPKADAIVAPVSAMNQGLRTYDGIGAARDETLAWTVEWAVSRGLWLVERFVRRDLEFICGASIRVWGTDAPNDNYGYSLR
jgi:hypothetical protein